MRILVTYASRHGATKGIAERIAATLERHGLEVVLAPAGEARQPEAFDAFVIGSAAYMNSWLGDATKFVRRNRKLLAGRPVWLFSSGPIGTELVDAKGRDVIEASIPKEFAEFGRDIHPRDEKVFFGAYDPTAQPTGIAEGFMSRFVRTFPAILDEMPTGDFRDWPAIEAWADGIAGELREAGAPVTAGA